MKSHSSCIADPPRNKKVLIREDFVAICEGNACAAALLNHLVYWHDIKLEQQKQSRHMNRTAILHGDPATQYTGTMQWHTGHELKESLLNIWGLNKIRESVRFLHQKGFVKISRNPNPRYSFDKTQYFQVAPDAINSAIHGISSEKVEEETEDTEALELINRELELMHGELQPVDEALEVISDLYTETTSEITPESVYSKPSENLDEQPTHTPAESSDQGKGIQVNETETQKVKTPSPVKNSHTEVEPISVSEQSSLENNSAGARENFAPSVAKNAPESVEATESVQSIAEPAKAAYSSNSAGVMNLSKFMQVYNACRGNWKPLSVAPPPVVVEGISSYRNRFDGTDEEFFQFFPLLVKAAQSSGGWLAGSRNPSQIFSVERLPLTDVWSDALQAKQPASATAKPIEVSPDFSLKSFID